MHLNILHVKLEDFDTMSTCVLNKGGDLAAPIVGAF
jgi:hypothetical protein